MSINWKEMSSEVTELIEEQKKEQKVFKVIPVGIYDVRINKMELRKNKNNDDMFFASFKIINDEYKGEYIPYFQNLTMSFQLKIIVDFLKSLKSGIEIDITNYDMPDYEKLIFDIFTTVKDTYEFKLDFGLNEKGFKKYKILEVSQYEMEELPF